MKRCLVTGGAGFIGSHLVEGLLKEKYKVIVLDDLSSGALSNLQPVLSSIEFVKGSVLNFKKLKEVCQNVDVVFHHAAKISVQESIEHLNEVHEINLTGTLNVLKAARDNRVKKIVYASSAAVYGDNGLRRQKESNEKMLTSPYGVQKLAGEYYCALFYKLWGIETASLRYFNVFGARQNPHSDYAGVISQFFHRIQSGKSPTIFGSGKQTRDFIHVQDVVQANILAAQQNALGGQILNIGSGKETSILELVDVLNVCLKTRVKPVFKAARPGDIEYSVADIGKAKTMLGFKPTFSLKAGLMLE